MRVRTPTHELPFATSLLLVIAGCLAAGCGPTPDDSDSTAPAEAAPGDAEWVRPDRPNVVLITHDTTRADRLSCYGYPRETSPNLDAVAAEGARFDLAISVASVTPVSHASILSGLYPYQHGLRVLYAGSGYTLPESVPTLATVLRDAGWSTGAFASGFPVSEVFGLDRGFDTFDNGLDSDPDEVFQSDGEHDRWDLGRFQRRSDDTTDAVLDWLDEVEEPFFLWVHYWDPHDSKMVPPKEFLERFEADSPSDLYDAEVAFVDAQFGRLVDALREDRRLDRTALAVTADHGQGLGDHDWWNHRLLYQEHIRLPLVLRCPGEAAGVAVQDLVRSVDLFPTLLELAGVDAPSVEGRSLLPLWRGEPDAPRAAYADQLNLWDSNAVMLEKRPDADLLHVWMERDWKLIYHPRAPQQSELYHLASDPGELVNVYSKHPTEAARLLAQLKQRDVFRDEGFGDVDPGDDRTDALNALGYLGDEGDE